MTRAVLHGVLLAALHAAGWVGAPRAEDFEDILRFLTRDRIHAVVSALITGVPKSIKKAELIAFARQNCDPGAFVGRLGGERLFVQRRAGKVEYLLFLYFGRVQQGLSQFTMRDLGLVRTQSFRDSYEPRYAEREEALEQFYYATRLDRLTRTRDLARLAPRSRDDVDRPGAVSIGGEGDPATVRRPGGEVVPRGMIGQVA